MDSVNLTKRKISKSCNQLATKMFINFRMMKEKNNTISLFNVDSLEDFAKKK
jgi:hypothetical protein